MTHDELTDRIHELFPQLADVEDRQWSETPAGEPFVLIEEIGFTGLASGAIELVGSIPKTGLVAVYRIEPDNRYNLVGLTDDPAIGMHAALNLGLAATAPRRDTARAMSEENVEIVREFLNAWSWLTKGSPISID